MRGTKSSNSSVMSTFRTYNLSWAFLLWYESYMSKGTWPGTKRMDLNSTSPSALYTAARKSGETSSEERRLQSTEFIAYKSCAECGTSCSAALPSGGWRSWRTLHDCVAGKVDVKCQSVIQFIPFTMMYCSLGNIRTDKHPTEKIRKNSCFFKCGTRTVDAVDPITGEVDFCSGNKGIVGKDDDAICLPLEECEELCKGEADCMSFDMHRRFNRCYLNKACPNSQCDGTVGTHVPGGCGPSDAASAALATSTCQTNNCLKKARR